MKTTEFFNIATDKEVSQLQAVVNVDEQRRAWVDWLVPCSGRQKDIEDIVFENSEAAQALLHVIMAWCSEKNYELWSYYYIQYEPTDTIKYKTGSATSEIVFSVQGVDCMRIESSLLHAGDVRALKKFYAHLNMVKEHEVKVEFTGEVNEVSDEDLEAASEWFDKLKNK